MRSRLIPMQSTRDLREGFIALYDRWDIVSARQDFEQARRLAPQLRTGAFLASSGAIRGGTKP